MPHSDTVLLKCSLLLEDPTTFSTGYDCLWIKHCQLALNIQWICVIMSDNIRQIYIHILDCYHYYYRNAYCSVPLYPMK